MQKWKGKEEKSALKGALELGHVVCSDPGTCNPAFPVSMEATSFMFVLSLSRESSPKRRLTYEVLLRISILKKKGNTLPLVLVEAVTPMMSFPPQF